jgi:hypothetical protein
VFLPVDQVSLWAEGSHHDTWYMFNYLFDTYLMVAKGFQYVFKTR